MDIKIKMDYLRKIRGYEWGYTDKGRKWGEYNKIYYVYEWDVNMKCKYICIVNVC